LAHFSRSCPLFQLSPDKGAEPVLYLATSPEVATASGYFAKNRPADTVHHVLTER